MHNDIMSSRAEINTDWMKQEILDQVNAAMEQFTLLESGEAKALEFCKVAVNSVIAKCTVEDVVDMYYHIMSTQDAISAPEDRLQCVHDYFNHWIELELAKRYA
jgi:hypothetical protein